MGEIFSNVPVIKYEVPDSKNPFAFKYYDADQGSSDHRGRTH